MALRRGGCGEAVLRPAVFKRMVGDCSGAVALMFAGSVFLLAAIVGGAIDFAQAYRAQNQIQATLDAATLAAARVKQTGGSDEAAAAAANFYLEGLRSSLPIQGPMSVDVIDGGTSVRAIADVRHKTGFLGAVGLTSLNVGANSIASFGIGSAGSTNVELSMMLDVTGSMSGAKLDALKDAAADLVGIVVAEDQSNATSKVAMVPFSSSVRLDRDIFERATGKPMNGPSGYKGCVVEREGANAFTDELAAAGSYVVPIEDKVPGKSCVNHHEVVPLTDNKNHLKSRINSLQADGSTAGHLGTAWAWYMLSPKWSSYLESASAPAPYSDLTTILPSGAPKLRKIAVLMTDGEYNTQYSGTSATDQARAICAAIKATGIEVFTVGFELGGNQSAIDTLSQCASDPSKFYNATTGDALKQAFRDIALKASPLRIKR